MRSSNKSRKPPDQGGIRHSRLRQTATFRNGRFDRWAEANIAVFGAGVVGGPLASGIVRSGASVGIFDFDVGEVVNLGTQPVEVGLHKAVSVASACNAICPGRARAFCCDVRHAGIGLLAQFDLLIDATDDAKLAMPLAEISNGLGTPMLRVALDGSGTSELGRVLCASAATGHACSICSYNLADLQADLPRTSCPDQPPNPTRPTIAGGAMAMTMAGLCLLAAQRLITRNDDALVMGRETWVDLTNLKMVSFELSPSDQCLCVHERWNTEPVAITASTATFRDLFRVAKSRLGSPDVTLEPFHHPLCTQATCACGEVVDAVGTRWAAPPPCVRCHRPMVWRNVTQITRLDTAIAANLVILETPLAELGLPAEGALIVARAADEPPIRLVLESTDWLHTTTV